MVTFVEHTHGLFVRLDEFTGTRVVGAYIETISGKLNDTGDGWIGRPVIDQESVALNDSDRGRPLSEVVSLFDSALEAAARTHKTEAEAAKVECEALQKEKDAQVLRIAELEKALSDRNQERDSALTEMHEKRVEAAQKAAEAEQAQVMINGLIQQLQTKEIELQEALGLRNAAMVEEVNTLGT